MATGDDQGAVAGENRTDLRDVPNPASCESGHKEFNSMSVAELEAVLNDPQPTISKRYRKRVLRRIEWLKRRPERRAQEKERKKRKRAASNGEAGTTHKRPTFTTMRESPCKIRVAIDLSLGAHMTDKEKVKCRKQIQRCYSLNRRSPAPVQVHTWKGDHVSCFGRENVVYLSSESDNELHELEEDKAYVIGGLVDHNRNKGLCHRLAEEQGVRHARLPIGNCLVMKTRQVLTIDQVFAILLRASRGQPWTEALLEVIPQRKGAKARLPEEAEEEREHSEEGEEDEEHEHSEEEEEEEKEEEHKHLDEGEEEHKHLEEGEEPQQTPPGGSLC
ncbi:hypothetical protein HPB48_003840 [Haemaphysalis longicornis]|uniref:tRNA (guanine(9)-N(1))-methyltransferase n=1 Tax=Haemaphysalis longicornis TaxID=44386 RepID=A0A9J6F6S0_HAELO|nr:hypothetical protein HPB48_003840 [Haemaphysalis longicornis]